ncbi:hypothetical protein G6F22_020679 [Rhizopus arrhizus]|nr:hypothetical protein G6F22_020679 [Rhizopus arrhizus]KAG1198592.1 hypothetical protein G6F35_012618 [Rhizopus arrhizus]
MHFQHVHDRRHLADRREVLDGVVVDLGVDAGRNAQRRRRHQQGVAVGLGARHVVGRDHRPTARLVLDNHGLPQLRRQAFGQQSAHDVRRAARRKRHYDAYGTGGIRILGKRRVRDADAGQRDAGQ